MKNAYSVEVAEAVLFGLALGDALGYRLEFKSLEQLKAQYPRMTDIDLPDPALYTDDTQMTLALAEGLLDAGIDADLDVQMEAVGKRFVTWMHSSENNRAPGMTCMSGTRRFEEGMSWRESGILGSKGCGAAMRVALLGYLYADDPGRLREVTASSAMITHRHPAGIASAVAAAYAVKLALEDVPPAQWISQIAAFIEGMSDEMDAALLRVGHVGAWTNEDEALRHIGEGWTGDDAVAMAIYCILRYPDDYVACMQRAVMIGGDSDSVACIAGGIMGARLGLTAIPHDWRWRCENRDMLIEFAQRLANARESVYGEVS